jgi:hypothetical protein
LAAWAALVLGQPRGWAGHAVVATLQWGALVAALGYARQTLNRDGPWRARLNEAVFPIYILHQTILLLAAWVLLPLAWPPLREGPVLVAVTLLLSWAGYEAIRRVDMLRPWFGLPRAAPPLPRTALAP